MALMTHGMILTMAIQSFAVSLWCNADAAHVEHNSVCTMTPGTRNNCVAHHSHCRSLAHTYSASGHKTQCPNGMKKTVFHDCSSFIVCRARLKTWLMLQQKNPVLRRCSLDNGCASASHSCGSHALPIISFDKNALCQPCCMQIAPIGLPKNSKYLTSNAMTSWQITAPNKPFKAHTTNKMHAKAFTTHQSL